jgi:hypothetical protein
MPSTRSVRSLRFRLALSAGLFVGLTLSAPLLDRPLARGLVVGAIGASLEFLCFTTIAFANRKS